MILYPKALKNFLFTIIIIGFSILYVLEQFQVHSKRGCGRRNSGGPVAKLSTPCAGGSASIPGQGTRTHMPAKTQNSQIKK